ncbi:hypothetical protein Pla52o_00710 [Novipirellula galeiformis]|uniref:Uncharacterized protein n=1 Tax=Novipirellula galeiformis TaxID=2528004 RepID=A0A5C6CPA8_9BACT|nr:hypothetical protein [Novipirellula galeiformis]TWU26218.1 hypothetical protein Pla52o_00710 [Novipirellula galeiformis]
MCFQFPLPNERTISTPSFNPYEPPAAELSSEESASVESAELEALLESLERMEFETDLTRADLADGIGQTHVRTDFVNLRTLAAIVIFLCLFVALLYLMVIPNSAALIVFSFPIVVTFALLVLRHRALRRAVDLNVHRCGAIHGYLDRDYFCVVHANQTRLMRMDHLVCAGRNAQTMTLCFDATQMQMEVLPFRAFADHEQAKMLADRLIAARPSCALQLVDRRRQLLPNAEPLFSPQANAVFYSGAIYASQLQGTKLGHQWKTELRRFALTLALCSTTTIVAWFYFAGFTWFGIGVGLVLLHLFWKPVQSLIKARQATLSNNAPLMMSSGWFDDSGQFSMATTGQSKSNWKLFDESEVSERMILLKINRANIWHLVARPQFEDDDAWESACRFVRRYGPPAN